METTNFQDLELEAKIEIARIKFEEARAIYDKQLPIVPLNVESMPPLQTDKELKRLTDNYNNSHNEYMSLLEQRRDTRFAK